jgi:hypothetical protein
MEVEGVMKREPSCSVLVGLLVSGALLLGGVGAMAQTAANPNPSSTLPLPAQTSPAGSGGSNTSTAPNDPTAPTTPAPAPPPTQKAPPAAQQSANPAQQQADPQPQGQAPQNPEPQKQTPQNQQSAPGENPAVQQTSPTGNNAITNEPNKTAPEAASPEAGNPQGKGSTMPGAAEASSQGDVGSLNAGQLTPEQLHERIEAALHSEPTLSGSNLTVNVSDDAIDLSGTVNSSKERLTARRIVQSFAGNRRVRERVTVAGGGARNANPNPSAQPNEKDPNPPNPPGQKSEVQNANRPITDPARHGDQSEEPR